MDMGHGDHMGPTSSSPAKHWTHMTFFWGSHSEILFTGWPGARPGMYALALVILFVLSVVYEWINHCRVIGPTGPGGVMRTGLHAARMGVMYVIMLAVMSFNVGLLIVVIVGHAVGFFLFGSGRSRAVGGEKKPDTDLPPIGC